MPIPDGGMAPRRLVARCDPWRMSTMIFASDNWAGASPKVAEALRDCCAGTRSAYGNDDDTRRLEGILSDLFEREVAFFAVTTGTAANALSLAAFTPPWGAVLSHAQAHIQVDECGAPEFFTGAKLIGLPGARAKIAPATLVDALAELPAGVVHHVQPSVVSITNATELGTIYRPDETRAIAEVAHGRGLALHMDGARFSNALVRIGCTPAELTWKAGVDVLSFGATKNGCLMAEGVVLFDLSKKDALGFLRKRGAQLLSKHRIATAQYEAWLDGGHWLELAAHANAMADRLAAGIAASKTARIAWTPEANEVFAFVKPDTDARLQAAGARYYEWSTAGLAPEDGPRDGEIMIRLIANFATDPADVDRFVSLLG